MHPVEFTIMRSKIIVAVLFIAVFAMNANAFCAGLCAGGHGMGAHHAGPADKGGHTAAGGKQGHEAHSCHHYANPQASVESHGGHEKAREHVCRVKGHDDGGRAISAKATKTIKSLPVIECNCMDESGAFTPETEAPISLGLHTSPALDLVAVVATEDARQVLSEFIPPEGPPKIS